MKTSNCSARMAVGALFVALTPFPALARQASLTVLDAAPPTTENFCGATAISDNGNFVGGYTRSVRTASGRGAALWGAGNVPRELRGFATKNLWGHVFALSPNGTVAVGSTTLANEEQPFRWMPGTGMQALTVPVGFAGGEARAVSANGSVVVGFGHYVDIVHGNPLPKHEAMVWKNGQPTALGFLNNGRSSRAYDVSADGRMIVGESFIDSSLGEYLAVMWINGVGPLEIGDLPGGYQRSRAVAVSADGSTVAGWGSKQYNPFIHRMFRWTRTGGMTDLGVAPGHLLAEATAMTADGNVIVGWGSKAGSNNRLPLIWDATQGLRDLVMVLEGAGVDVSAWRDLSGQIFMQATGISADGKTVVGYGNFNNSRRGWIAQLP